MKQIFRKAMTVLGSVALVGATIGFAVAASYPSPFTSNTVVVYSSSGDVAPSDMTAATDIRSDLIGNAAAGTGDTATGGDSVVLEKGTDRLNLGNSAATVFGTSVDEEDLPTLLAEGTYTDDDNTEYDYTQKITLGSNLGVEFFADSDYNDKEPTVGIKMSSNEHVLNYTLDFTTHPPYNASALETTTLTLMGKEYYVLDVVGVGDSTSNKNKTTLLDTASSAIVVDKETLTLDGHDISIEYISSTQVKLNVDGEITNLLGNGGTFKLTDGTYVGVKAILYDAKDTGTSKAEISVGKGKLEIPNGQSIELNDVTVNEIVGFVDQDSTYKVDKITLKWATDDEEFIAGDSELVMPGFEAVKLTSGGLVVDSEEESSIENSGTDVIELKTTIKSGEVSIPLLKANSTGDYTVIGKSTDERLVTTKNPFIFVNETAGDDYIVASYNSSQEAESYYVRVQIIQEDNVNKVRFTDKITGTEKVSANASSISFGNVDLTVNNLTRSGEMKWANISINSGGSFQTLYTNEGLKFFLPYYATSLTDAAEGSINTTANSTVPGQTAVANPWVANGLYNWSVLGNTGHGHDTFYVYADEADKDGNLAAGKMVNATLDDNSDNEVGVSAIGINTGADNGQQDTANDKNYINYVTSDLATKSYYETGGDQDTVTFTYHGKNGDDAQAYVNLRLSAPDVTVGGGDSSVITVTDTEAESISKNMIVVGGSAINSIAAELLGGAYREGDFTTQTSVGAGEFLIQSFDRNGRTALLVAGYNAADTVKATDYLLNNDVKTDVGTKYKGTSATEATLVV